MNISKNSVMLRIVEGPSKLNLLDSFCHADDYRLEILKAMTVLFAGVPNEQKSGTELVYFSGLVVSMEFCSNNKSTYKLKLVSYPDLDHKVIITCYYSAHKRNGYAFISETNYPYVVGTYDMGSLNNSGVLHLSEAGLNERLKKIEPLGTMTTNYNKGNVLKRVTEAFRKEAKRIAKLKADVGAKKDS